MAPVVAEVVLIEDRDGLLVGIVGKNEIEHP